MQYLGDFAADATSLSFNFNTRKLTGEPVNPSISAIDVYKDGEGPPLSLKFDSLVKGQEQTGRTKVYLRLAENDDVIIPGHDYTIVITTGTVDGTSVAGTVLAQFSIENRYTGSSASGAGAVKWEYSLTEEGSGDPITDCRVWVTSDKEGRVVIGGPLYTDAAGSCTFYLDEGTVYVWCMKAGYLFANPDEETVAAA